MVELPGILDRLGTIDAFLHDSEHTYKAMKFEYELAIRHLSKGGLLMSDDITWNKAFNEISEGRKKLVFHDLGLIQT